MVNEINKSTSTTEFCFICSKEARTDEHVIPKWLQKRFNLWDDKILLPNQTTIPYRQLTIPCCKICNNKILSPIENAVQHGEPDDLTLWKWAIKIHYGLNFKHQFLEWDRSHPGYKIGQVINLSDPLEIERHLIHSITGSFKTDPSPFGSIFRFSFKNKEPYYFVHLMMHPSILICLENVGYVIFIKDSATLQRQPGILSLHEDHSKKATLGTMLNFYANSFMHLDRHKTTQSILLTNGFISASRPELIKEEPIDPMKFKDLWQYLNQNKNAPVIDNDEYFKNYLKG